MLYGLLQGFIKVSYGFITIKGPMVAHMSFFCVVLAECSKDFLGKLHIRESV